jgi:predicted MFS family arabinose efflux permease
MALFETAQLAQGIQLAVAPVFLLTAVAALIGALAGRLARIIDRARWLEERLDDLPAEREGQYRRELKLLRIRGLLVNWAIGLLTLTAILTGLTVFAIFLSEVSHLKVSPMVPVFFLGGMAAFIAALLCFLREVTLSMRTLNFGKSNAQDA